MRYRIGSSSDGCGIQSRPCWCPRSSSARLISTRHRRRQAYYRRSRPRGQVTPWGSGGSAGERAPFSPWDMIRFAGESTLNDDTLPPCCHAAHIGGHKTRLAANVQAAKELIAEDFAAECELSVSLPSCAAREVRRSWGGWARAFTWFVSWCCLVHFLCVFAALFLRPLDLRSSRTPRTATRRSRLGGQSASVRRLSSSARRARSDPGVPRRLSATFASLSLSFPSLPPHGIASWRPPLPLAAP